MLGFGFIIVFDLFYNIIITKRQKYMYITRIYFNGKHVNLSIFKHLKNVQINIQRKRYV